MIICIIFLFRLKLRLCKTVLPENIKKSQYFHIFWLILGLNEFLETNLSEIIMLLFWEKNRKFEYSVATLVH